MSYYELTTKAEDKHFSLDNYPKSYASTKPNDYRLRDFLNQDDESLDKLNDELFDLCMTHEDATKARDKYKDYEYLDSGYEWSVFKKPGEDVVIKVPAGIFPEVNDPIYLENSEETYQTIKASYPPELVADSKFYQEDSLNIIEQEFIKGQVEFKVDLNSTDQLLLTNFRAFLEGTLKLVTDYEWLPDYWFKDTPEGILVRNVILEDETKLFKIIDFAQYLDPSRMYPAKTERVIAGQITRLNELLTVVNNQLTELP